MPFVLLAAVLALAYGPLLAEFGANLWSKPHYQHYPFVLLAAVLFLARGLRTPRAVAGRTAPGWAVAAVGVAWGLLLYSYHLHSPWLAAVSLVLLIGGVLALWCGAAGASFPLGPWLLLLLVVPPPMSLDHALMTSLQRVSSTQASILLDRLGVNHLMQGNLLFLGDRQLFVDEACSGIISVTSIIACAALYSVLRHRPALHAGLLLVGGAIWATLLNVVRIALIAVAQTSMSLDWATGAAHTALGLGVLALALLMLLATDWLVGCLLAEIAETASADGEPGVARMRAVSAWDALVAWPGLRAEPVGGGGEPSTIAAPRALAAVRPAFTALLAVFGLAIPLQLIQAPSTRAEASALRPFDAEPAVAALMADGVMPARLLGLQLQSVEHVTRARDDNFGEHSVVFTYQSERGERHKVSCDFPYPDGWHDLTECYRGIGWTLDALAFDVGDTLPLEYAQLSLSRADLDPVIVTFTAWDAHGDWLPAARPRGLLVPRRRAAAHGHTFQAQVLSEYGATRQPELDRVGRDLLEAAAPRFVAALQGDPSAGDGSPAAAGPAERP